MSTTVAPGFYFEIVRIDGCNTPPRQYPPAFKNYITEAEWTEFYNGHKGSIDASNTWCCTNYDLVWNDFNDRFNRPDRCNRAAGTWRLQKMTEEYHDKNGTTYVYRIVTNRLIDQVCIIPTKRAYGVCSCATMSEWDYIDQVPSQVHGQISEADWSGIIQQLNNALANTRVFSRFCFPCECLALIFCCITCPCLYYAHVTRAETIKQTIDQQLPLINERLSTISNNKYKLIRSPFRSSDNNINYRFLVLIQPGLDPSVDNGQIPAGGGNTTNEQQPLIGGNTAGNNSNLIGTN